MTEVMQLILAGVGIGISLITTYVAPVANWYYNILDKKWRGLVMAGFSLFVTAIIFGLSCTGLFSFLPCTQDSIFELLKAWVILFATNQLTYLSTPTSTYRKS